MLRKLESASDKEGAEPIIADLMIVSKALLDARVLINEYDKLERMHMLQAAAVRSLGPAPTTLRLAHAVSIDEGLLRAQKTDEASKQVIESFLHELCRSVARELLNHAGKYGSFSIEQTPHLHSVVLRYTLSVLQAQKHEGLMSVQDIAQALKRT